MTNAFTKITEYKGISEYRLESNGLKVVLAPQTAAPVVTFMVVYRVGSRNEAVGHTGSTHLLEHMLFKGTPTYNKKQGNQIAAVLQRQGAMFNADTWFDRTRYYELLPSDQLELAIQIEADRMRNSFIADEDRQSEMTVVRNEMDRGENEPASILGDRIWAAAFREHPYHHPTIGWRADVEGVPTERLKEFYDVYYHPNNAVALVCGDFDEAATLALIEQYFGAIPASSQPIPPMYTVEPAQEGENRFVLRRAGQMGIVECAWRIPAAKHADSIPLAVLSTVLTAGMTSRLYQALIETELALDESAGALSLLDPGLFSISATVNPDVEHVTVEAAIHEVIAKLATEPIAEAELRKAKNMMQTQLIYQQDSCMSIVRGLSEAEVVVSWQHYLDFPANVEAVSAADIQRVVQTYFTEDNRTVGWFIPKIDESLLADMPDELAAAA